MNPLSFTLILIGVLLNAIAQLLLKAGVNAAAPLQLSRVDWFPTVLRVATQWPIIAGLFCYVISVVVWIAALTRVPVTVAYPMLSIGYVVNALLACYLLGETLSPMRMIGIVIILVGVFVLTRG
ncbi:MAG: SMR family transporter [Janthinobacterium lividum]